MKTSRRVAYGGVLTGFSIVLLWVASTTPAVGWGMCMCAGLLVAIPLARRYVRTGGMIYIATTLLALLIVPRKRFVIAYILLFGIYPIIKYGIEHIRSLPLEWGCKLIYASFLCAILTWFVRSGLLVLTDRAFELPYVVLVAGFLIAFSCYDIVFSKIIALFRIFFRE